MIRSWGYLKPFQTVGKSRITTWAFVTDRRRGSNSITETASSCANYRSRYPGFPGGFYPPMWRISPVKLDHLPPNDWKGVKNQKLFKHHHLVSDAILDQFWFYKFALMMVSRHILATKSWRFLATRLPCGFFRSLSSSKSPSTDWAPERFCFSCLWSVSSRNHQPYPWTICALKNYTTKQWYNSWFPKLELQNSASLP